MKFLIKMRKQKIIKNDNLMSLESWINMRAQVCAQVLANTQNKKDKDK